MPTFSAGDVVRTPFPYTDRNTQQHRPALVISNAGTGLGEGQCWVLMITSAENRPWPGDVSFGDAYAEAGLPAPSVIRPSKVATVDRSRLERLGRVSPITLQAVDNEISRIIGRG